LTKRTGSHKEETEVVVAAADWAVAVGSAAEEAGAVGPGVSP
jgi:hypothetical protein